MSRLKVAIAASLFLFSPLAMAISVQDIFGFGGQIPQQEEKTGSNSELYLQGLTEAQQQYIIDHRPPDPTGIYDGNWELELRNAQGTTDVYFDLGGGGINTEGKGVIIKKDVPVDQGGAVYGY